MKSQSDSGNIQDPNAEENEWSCNNYNNHINDDQYEINKNLQSVGKNDTLKLVTQKDQIQEFMKILSLAHMCVAETFTDKQGKS